MFGWGIARRQRRYDEQPSPEFLFARRPFNFECVDRRPGQFPMTAGQPRAVLAMGTPLPYRLTRLDEMNLSRDDIPALTVAVDSPNGVAVEGSARPDWRIRFCASGDGETEVEAREHLERISMTRIGNALFLGCSHSSPERARGVLVVDAPADAPAVIHAPFASVEIRDMAAPVRVAATHARVTILDSTGQLDVSAGLIDFAGSRGRVSLSAEREINLKIKVPRFEGTLLAWAYRPVRMVVPRGFLTPFRAIVSRPRDFICRADFARRITHVAKNGLHYFTYAGETNAAPAESMTLRSEQATVVIDLAQELN